MHLRSQSKTLIARVLPASLLFSPSSTVAKRFRLRSARLWLPETEVQSYSLTGIPMDSFRFRLSTPAIRLDGARPCAICFWTHEPDSSNLRPVPTQGRPLAEFWIVMDLLIATSSLLKNILEQVTYVSFVERGAGTLSRRLFSTSSISMALLLSGHAIPTHHAHMIQTIASVPTSIIMPGSTRHDSLVRLVIVRITSYLDMSTNVTAGYRAHPLNTLACITGHAQSTQTLLTAHHSLNGSCTVRGEISTA